MKADAERPNMTDRVDLSKVKFVLFDLGGVLIHFRGIEAMRDLLAGHDQVREEADSLDQLWQRWIESPAVRKFERGASGAEEFASGVVSEFRLPISAQEFERSFAGWVTGVLPGALELLEELPREIGRGCLSNTNSIHWEMFPELGLRGVFDREYVSFKLGLLKPDLNIFEHCIRDLELDPAQILFFDDIRINVEGAKRAGLQSALAKGPEDCRTILSPLLG